MPELIIRNRPIGDEHPPVVIAEIGINHGGSLDLAIRMADAAIDAGAEIVKHQTHVIEDEMSEEAKSVIPGNADISIYEIMDRCALSEEDERRLMQHIHSRGSIFISTPFSRAAADRLKRFDVPAIKIGSGECNNYPLIKHVAKLGKPVIVSTGMNTLESVRPTVEILRAYNPDAVIGLSDHTISNYPCLGAVALGASILERHFTDSMEREGPDIVCSMDPKALSELIQGSRIIFTARGGKKGPVDAEAPTIAFAFASVVATKDIKPGEKLTEENIWVKRPGGGDYGVLDYDTLMGKEVLRPIKRGYQLRKDQIALDLSTQE